MDLCMDCATVITASILTLLPALCAGALTSQASKLKLMLHDKLLQQQGNLFYKTFLDFMYILCLARSLSSIILKKYTSGICYVI